MIILTNIDFYEVNDSVFLSAGVVAVVQVKYALSGTMHLSN